MNSKDQFKDSVWSYLLKMGVNTNPLLASLVDTLNDFSTSNLNNWTSYFKSQNKVQGLADGDVACIMCTWKEEKMVSLAIESSKDFVSRYIIVDKDGDTAPIIESCRDQWGLDMEIHIKPKLSLRESRAFALTRITEPWVFIQDGDEICHTDGPNAIQGLRQFMGRPNVLLSTPMNFLCGDLRHTSPLYSQQKHHMFLYHNNGTLKESGVSRDLPVMDGWKIYLCTPYKFNCPIKSPKRMYLRQFWNDWCHHTENNLKYPNIEDYVTEELGININEEVEKWYKQYIKSLIPYDEKRWGYYPKVIINYMKNQDVLYD